MSFRFTLVLLVVAVVAIAGFGIAQKAQPGSAASTATPTAPLLDFTTTAVTDLDVKTADHETELSRSNSPWALVKPQADPNVDQSRVNALVSELLGLNAGSPVAKSSDDLTQYGVKTPSITVTLKATGNKTNVLAVGNKTIDGNNSYVLKQGGDVQLMPSNVVTDLTGLANTPPRATPTPTPSPTSAVTPTATPAPATTPSS